MGDNDPVEAVEHELTVLLRRARATSGSIAREVHPDIGAAAYGILTLLQQTDGTRMTDVASYFGVGKPTISRQVGLLERLGLVERAEDAEDRRSVTLRLTEEGTARLSAAQEARRAQFRALLDSWPRRDLEALGRLLHRFNALQF
ncbi:MarR family winged helix-turn-helix transcriptional regulator [Actinopolymorpha alba]|uniref:MarR family winged helix-turn-helix transcriptional regulator n=1 Tax=Actinopolymorpha alba TaxID=533267 RepID=UPI00036B5DBE|nr:MarR family transcriptional regulator [Actinopolymorpha alba]